MQKRRTSSVLKWSLEFALDGQVMLELGKRDRIGQGLGAAGVKKKGNITSVLRQEIIMGLEINRTKKQDELPLTILHLELCRPQID